MSYTVLARRYRSTGFAEVVGQEPIAKTLTNAIKTGRVAHAFLFTGTRGVGKTSMARILARALNAPETIDDCPKLPDGEYPPADVQQRMADAIMTGQDLNVIEIDGASNRGVDEARQIIANAGLAPTGNAQFKIYIIDEVHMLTAPAFNALLKTMEEPPPHVKFILCTTDPHKVPETIQSRCQRFDFRNIPTAQIADHLTAVLKKEKCKADKDAVWEVARLANGSMRDGLSLLDRLIAAAGDGKLSAEVLQQVLGLPPRELVIALVDALADGDPAAALQRTNDLLSRGIAQDQVIDVLIDRLRQLMLIAACGAESELIELSDTARDEAAKQAARFDAAGLVHMIALCEGLQRQGKQSSNPRALLDAAIVRLALAEKMADVAALLSSAEGGTRPAATAGEKKKSVGETRGAEAEDRFVQSVRDRAEDALRPVQSDREERRAEPRPAVGERRAKPQAAGEERVDAGASEARTGSSDPWSVVLAAARERAALSWIASFQLARVEGGVAYVKTVSGRSQLAKFIAQPSHRDQLARLLGDALGSPVRVELQESSTALAESAAGEGEATVERDTPASNGAEPTVREQVMQQPLVRRVLDTFEATVVDIRADDDATNPSD